MFKIITGYAFRNLTRKWLRTFFTLVSVILIIMLYTVVISIGNSFNDQLETVLKSESIDIAVQDRYASTPVTSMIDLKHVSEIVEIDGIRSYEMLLIARKRMHTPQGGTLFILGVSSFTTFANQLGFNLSQGKLPFQNSNRVVIGDKTAQLFKLSTNDKLDFGHGFQYDIAGVYSSWLNFLNAGVVMDLTAAQKLSRKQNSISLLLLQLDDPLRVEEILKKINTDFPMLRAIESQQLPNTLGSVKSFLYFFKIISFVTLFIATAILLNTFVMIISERTKEIGILSAIGWPRLRILLLFFIESLLLSVTGGMMGFLLAFPVITWLKNNYISIALYLPDTPEVTTLLAILIISVVVSLLSVLFPSIYGTNIPIAKALRHE